MWSGTRLQNVETPDGSSVSTESELTFTEAEEKLYQARYEEGYNLLNEMYGKWLEQNNPLDIPADLQPSLSSGDTSEATPDTHQTITVTPGSTSPLPPTDLTNPENMNSILDIFHDISPEEPLLLEADLTMPTSEPVTAEMDTSTCNPV